jgi:hypothetical protein
MSMSKEEEILKRGIFIPGEVPSSKNSKEIGFIFLKNGSQSRTFVKRGEKLIPVRFTLNSSKATKRYVKDHAIDYIANKVKFQRMIKDMDPPYRVVFKFIRKTKRKFDYINAAQIVQDMMATHDWIVDDDCNNLKPYFIDYEVNKNEPGVIISVF